MDRYARGIARIYSALLDGELGKFLHAISSARRDRVGRRSGASGCLAQWFAAIEIAFQKTSLGTRSTCARAPHLNVAERECVSLEFSLAAILPFDPRALRGGSVAQSFRHSRSTFTFGASGCPRVRPRCRGCDRDVDLPHGGSLCLSLYLDFSRARWGLDVRRAFLPKSRTGSRLDAGRRHVCCIARDILLHSAELRRAEIQSRSKTDGSGAARSATPLFEHLSAAGTELSRGKKTGTGRTNRAARQHVDVGRTALHQRLQPDSPGWGRARIRVRGPRRNRSEPGTISAGRTSGTAR